MNLRRFNDILAGTFLIALFLIPTHAPALAADADDADTAIEEATVNLYCRIRAGKTTLSASGSGVFIGEQGVILTNAHVAQYFLLPEKKGRVTSRCSVRGGSPARKRYEAVVLYFPEVWIEKNERQLSEREPKGTGEHDYALLYVTEAKNGRLPDVFPALTPGIASIVAKKDMVTIAGYPSEGLDFDQINEGLTLVTASSTIQSIRGFGSAELPDIITLAPSEAGAPGISGGPVLNEDDTVIGIATVKSTRKEDRTLRALTLSYIARAIATETGRSFASFLAGDLPAQAEQEQNTRSLETLKIITKTLHNKNKR